MEKINTSECQKQYKSPLEKGLQISAVLFCIYNLFRISSQGFLTSNLIENVILTASSILFLYGTSNKHIKSIGQYCMVMFSDVVYNFVNFMTNALGYMMMSEKANNNVKHEKRDVEEDFDIGKIAAAFGAPEEAIEKAREAQQRAEAQGRDFTLASAADLAEAAGAPESVISGLRSMGEKQIEELKEKGEKIFSKRDYQGYDLAEVARLLGAPEEAIGKAKKVQERAAAEGRVITLDGAADLAEAAGAPDFVVEQLRAYGANERAEIANEENQLPNLKKRDVEEFDIGKIAAAFGASEEAIEKAREAQQRAEAQGRDFTLASAADLAEAAGAPESVISGLRSMGEKQIEELREKGEKIFSKRDYQGYDLAEVARLLGAPEEAIGKAKKVQERAAAEGRVITLDGAADLAEAAGAPDFVVEQLRAYGANERAEIANEENQLPNLKKRDVEEDFDIGKIAAAFGASEEAIEKAREAQQRAKAQGRDFTLASAADLAEAAGAPESVISGLRSMGEKQVEELKEKGEKIFSKRDYQGYDLAEVARLLGAPEEAIEKAKKVQERAAAEGRVITLDGAADLAEAAGAPDFVVEQLRAYGANERAGIANEENQLPNLKKRDVEEFDIGKIAAAFGASEEAIEKAREAQQRAEAQGRDFTLASAADLAEAAGAPESVISGLRSMGEKQIEELREKGEKIFSKRDYQGYDLAEVARLLGAPEEAIGKAKKVQERAAAEGRVITLDGAADLAEAAGAPDFVVEQLRAYGANERAEIANEENQLPNLKKRDVEEFDIGKIAAAFGASEEAIEKAREAQQRAEAQGRDFTLASAADLAEAAGAPESVISGLRSMGEKQVEELREKGEKIFSKRDLSDGLLTDAKLTNAFTNVETIGELNSMKKNMYVFGESGILALILGCFAYKYYRQIKRQIRNNANADVKYQQV